MNPDVPPEPPDDAATRVRVGASLKTVEMAILKLSGEHAEATDGVGSDERRPGKPLEPPDSAEERAQVLVRSAHVEARSSSKKTRASRMDALTQVMTARSIGGPVTQTLRGMAVEPVDTRRLRRRERAR